jgi:hypothetical protein
MINVTAVMTLSQLRRITAYLAMDISPDKTEVP